MFKDDKAIETAEDDLLGRVKFSKHLSNAILSWSGQANLSIGIYGQWGSGKSSVINLLKGEILNSENANKPTILEYNPWDFTQQERIAEHFFNEIAKELKHKGNGKKDKEIALELKKLSRIISFLPNPSYICSDWIIIASSFITVVGLVSYYIPWSQFITPFLTGTAVLSWVALGFLKILGKIFGGMSEILDIQSQINEKSNSRLKKEISELLRKRKSKLLVIIDDIDRLSADEIRKMFALIRGNADFPNVIYLLAFDRKIVEKSLGEGDEINGREFLEKIVQVPFEIPHVRIPTIRKIFLKEIDAFFSNYPEIQNRFFGVKQTYWAYIYLTEFEDLLGNLRRIHRFLNSFRFNFMQLLNVGVLEVNPIDLMAIEAIRIFEPDYYEFMKKNGNIFTSLIESKYYETTTDDRKVNFERSLLLIKDKKNRSNIEVLIRRLFPLIDAIYTNTTFSNYRSFWFSDLRICSPDRFDRYFTLLPGNEEDELSELQIQNILSNLSNPGKLKECFDDLIEAGKFKTALEQLQNYTSNEIYFDIRNLKSIAMALFDAIEKSNASEEEYFNFEPDLDVYIILIQILIRSNNKDYNYIALSDAIRNSQGISCPAYIVSALSKRDADRSYDNLIDDDKILLLQELCVSKIKENRKTLLQRRFFKTTLYRWKEWGNPIDVNEYLVEITNDSENLLTFLGKFVEISKSFGTGGLVGPKMREFQLNLLKDFTDTLEIEKKIKSIEIENPELYKINSEVIGLFIDAHKKHNVSSKE
ncbi:P-loop NTPase fold protein [Leptospira interrogans]|uniref:KAP family P-loop NTPase fold protein n=1 Tax=Leptospira interrogans TaxID=173 RepID=UPI00122CA61F|nr:P-loop NTPase fold protein [Leptospira interrogans]KAA1266899.1 NTPase KAP [Leptospira interrogans serovar Weerasinghe]ULG80054.1 P-loop NTPase fold protein [Leptospira interrogans]UML67689.1 P-loop NTPase fold protein [Leptospira interrogans]UML71011.1 P-loop NTPase fold protein [Leptospira interrogans]